MSKEENVPDLTKYVTGGDPCPFCGALDATDSTDEDTGPYGEGGRYETHEKWACGECHAQWDAVFTFVRLVPK